MNTSIEMLGLIDAIEKQASVLDDFKIALGKNPALLSGILGSVAGGGLGALVPSTDEQTGETHRLRNALLGALLGGGAGAGAGYLGRNNLREIGFNAAKDKGWEGTDDAVQILMDVLKEKSQK